MLKPPDIAGINPVARILPVLGVERIGNTGQELDARATQFVRGQEYLAQILSKVSDTAYNVKVDGTVLRMDLGSAASTGQTILLRYMQDGPVPTFSLLPAPTRNSPNDTALNPATLLVGHYLNEAEDKIGAPRHESKAFVSGQEYLARVLSKVSDTTYNVKVDGVVLKMELGSAAKTGQSLLLQYVQESSASTLLFAPTPAKPAGGAADLSLAAHLIGHYLKEAEVEGASARYEATAVVTHTPKNPQVIAQDLKQAVSSSGLFYESHLSELVQGNRTLAAVMQEPQNQSGSPIAALMSQQLAILENQRMAWHGEVWPGQKMSWDVYLQQRDAKDDGSQRLANGQQGDEAGPIASEMTLHLPRLGKVSAKLSLINGRMRINILAEQVQTLDALEQQRAALAEAIVKNGQQLDSLTVVRHE